MIQAPEIEILSRSSSLTFPPHYRNQVLERGFRVVSTENKGKGATIKVLIQRIQVSLLCRPFNGENDKGLHLFAMRAPPEPARRFSRRRLLLAHIASYRRGTPPRRPDMYIRWRSLPDRMLDAGKSVSLVSSDR